MINITNYLFVIIDAILITTDQLLHLNPELAGVSAESETTHWGSCAAFWPPPS